MDKSYSIVLGERLSAQGTSPVPLTFFRVPFIIHTVTHWSAYYEAAKFHIRRRYCGTARSDFGQVLPRQQVVDRARGVGVAGGSPGACRLGYRRICADCAGASGEL